MDKPTHLLVVIDPTASEHCGLERARRLALAFHASVELFVNYQPAAPDAIRVDERALERLANRLREQGIDTATEVCSAPTIHGGIVARVLRSPPSMVIKETHPHSLLHRSVLSNTDWQLIRTCPVPLLFVRPGQWSVRPNVAAAVDVAMPGEKPAALDHALLSAAETFALATEGQLHAVHAYEPISPSAAMATTIAVPMAGEATVEQIINDNQAHARKRFDEVLSGHAVTSKHRHLVAGLPGEALVNFVRTQAIDLLVMGAYSRGWMYNVFVGGTTERLLDYLPCDVLVLRPENTGRAARVSGEQHVRATPGL